MFILIAKEVCVKLSSETNDSAVCVSTEDHKNVSYQGYKLGKPAPVSSARLTDPFHRRRESDLTPNPRFSCFNSKNIFNNKTQIARVF